MARSQCCDPPGLCAGPAVVQASRLTRSHKMENSMAKKQRFDYAAVSTRIIARRKGRQSPQDPGSKRAAAAPATTEIGDQVNSALDAGALPESTDHYKQPEAPDRLNRKTIGSLEVSAAEPEEPSPESTVHAGGTKTKRAQLIELLERPEGATIGEMGDQLGWLPHTVRAALTGLRHAGREVNRDKNAEGRSIYRLNSGGTSIQ